MQIVRQKADIKEHYANVFKGVGCFPGPPYHIQVDPKVPPKQTPVRPVPIHLKEAIKQELDKMLHAGYIKPVHEATPWINSYVIVDGIDKQGNLKLRICLDPTNLNPGVIREPWFSKTPDDIAHLLADAVILTTTDCTKGFWHQPLDEQSSYLTTFGTEFGRFRFTVMPFGITVAGDVFQRKLDTIFGNLPQVACIADDIIVVGYKEDHSDHDIAFSKLLHTAYKNNVKLNYDKLQYKQTQVNFFGETYTTDGRKPSLDKVHAITKMPQPTNKKELQSFIGMVNYLSKFTPRLSELAECLQDLIRINVPFQWGPEHIQAFNSIKQEIIKAPILKYYDSKKPTVLQMDASIKGLGACLLQCGHPVYFGSKALTDSQKGYVAIELEALAVSWAMEKFHHFLYATKFVLETDQKPSEAILAKSLNAATPRLQRILIKTFAYDFTVKYLPGENNQLADCLSRLGCLQDKIKLPRMTVHLITTHLSATSDKLQQIRQATQDDDTMALLRHTITYGWPTTVQELPKELQAYWTFREEMSVEDGLILKATRIVIPPSMQESIIQQLHEGHLGFTKCFNRAKQTVYWPNLRKELEELVLNCKLCLKHSSAKRKPKPTPSFGQEIPVVPWTKLASDIFHFQNDSYLLIVDFTSRFPVVRKLKSMTAKHVASHFSQVFGEYGWPDTLLTDNGPCYAAQEFKKLKSDMSVNHITSSPHYPQSNGLAEKYVQIVKNLFMKAHEEGTDYQKALMIYRNTPLDDKLISPMQLLQGRSARSDLPMSYAAKIKYGIASSQPLPPALRQDKNHRAPTHDYKLHQDIMYLEPIMKKWYPIKIVRLLDAKRSYMIKTTEGVEYRKTQQHLKPYKPRKVCSPPRCTKDVNPGQDRPKRSTRPPDKLDL